MGIEITLAGDVGIRGEEPVGTAHLNGAQARAAFALLTLERAGGVSRDQLVEVVWPSGVPATWASALRTVVSRVRAFVSRGLSDAEPLVAEGGRYLLRLPDDVEVDVEVAERAMIAAQAALAGGDVATARRLADESVGCLRLPFLPGIEGEWVDRQRVRLGGLLVGALETTCHAALVLGDAPGALAAAEESVARAPLRESAHRARLAALAAGGNRAEALRAYQALRRALAEELGVDPSPETEAAYLDLLGAPSTASPAPGTGSSEATGGSGATGGTPETFGVPTRQQAVRGVGRGAVPFVGRERELEALAELWRHVLGGARHLVLVTGEAGIGKTRLVAEAARRVPADGGMVLLGRCDETAAFPFQPLVEALDGYVAATPGDELRILDDDVRAELAPVLPSLGKLRRAAAGTVPSRRARLFGAITALVVGAAAERPLMLVLDDLQWADGDTLAALSHLVRRAGAARVLVVAVSRDHDVVAAHPLADVIHSLDRDGWVRRLPLSGLAEREVRALVGHVRASGAQIDPTPAAGTERKDAALARRIVGETAGNPFFLLELLRETEDDEAIPPGVHDLVAVRLSRLASGTAMLLRTAAVTGLRFDVDIVAAAAGLDEGAALDAFDEALASGLVVEELADRYRFSHDIVRRTIQTEMSGARRRTTHRRVAGAIETQRADRIADHLGVLAHHSAAGAGPGGDPRAVRWCRAAAAQAAERSGYTEAARLYQRALDHVSADDAGTRADLLVAVGSALVQSGDPGGEAALVDAVMEARRAGRRDAMSRGASVLADLAVARPEVRDEALALIEVALSVETADEPGGVAARGDVEAARLDRARLMARRAELSGIPPSEVPIAVLGALRRRLDRSEGPDRREERQELAIELAHLVGSAGDPTSRIAAAHHRAMAAALIGEGATADKALADLAAASSAALSEDPPVGAASDGATGRERGLTVGALLAERDAAAAVRDGRWDDALAAAAEASDWYRTDANPAAAALAIVRQSEVVGWLRVAPANGEGGSEGAVAELASRDEIAGGSGAASEYGPGLVLAELARGERGRALVRIRGLLNGADPLPEGDAWLHAVGVLGLAAAELGDADVAGRVCALLAPHADLVCGVGYRSFVGAATYHLGRLTALCGDAAEAERHLQASLRTHALLGARAWVALSQHALADVLETRARPFDREIVAALRSESRWVTSDLGMRQLSMGAQPPASPGR